MVFIQQYYDILSECFIFMMKTIAFIIFIICLLIFDPLVQYLNTIPIPNIFFLFFLSDNKNNIKIT